MRGTHHDLCEIHNPGPATREWMIHRRRSPHLAAHDLIYLGCSAAQAGFEFRRTAPPFDLVLGCVAGRGELALEGEAFELEAGQAALLPAWRTHSYCWAGPQVWHVWWLVFEPGTLADVQALRVTAEVDLVDHCIRGFVALDESDALSSLGAHFAALVSGLCLRAFHRSRRALRLRALWSAVESDPARPWTNAELAGRVGMSVETLRRVSRQETGRSPMAHVTHLRMTRASLLLARSSRSVKAIAGEVGYQDAFAFSVAFKRWSGLSPRDYRQWPSPGRMGQSAHFAEGSSAPSGLTVELPAGGAASGDGQASCA
jgi:AraC-like DNA-binding protein